ncbi:MAG: PDZ domain-containing protein [Candidatus Eisenbacteria bacterium]
MGIPFDLARALPVAVQAGAIFLSLIVPAAWAGESVPHGFLGVTTQELTAPLREALDLDEEAGVLVNRVAPGSPAERSEIRVGDVLTRLNGKDLESPRALGEAVSAMKPGDRARVTLLRNGKKRTVRVEVGSRPERGSVAARVSIGGGAYLGVKLHDPDAELAPYFSIREGEGVLVLEAEEESPASGAGIRSGDIILAIDGEPTGKSLDLVQAIAKHDPGDRVEVEILREGNEERIPVALGEKSLLPWAGKGLKPFVRFDRERSGDFEMRIRRQLEKLEDELERLKREMERLGER